MLREVRGESRAVVDHSVDVCCEVRGRVVDVVVGRKKTLGGLGCYLRRKSAAGNGSRQNPSEWMDWPGRWVTVLASKRPKSHREYV